eukprot:gene48875-biopygen34191
MVIIVGREGLRRFFASARGAPQKKHVIVEEILAAQGLARERCLFVGDAMTDHDCARVCAMDFLGRAPAGHSPFPAGTRVVERLGEAFLAPLGLRHAA